MEDPTHHGAPAPTDDPWLRSYAQLLGYLGWTPLAALLVLSWLSPERSAPFLRVSLLYTAALLSFIGGIQWGLALGSGNQRIRLRRLVVSMVPTLWAVAALLVPVGLGLLALVLGLVVLLIYETLERGDAVYPTWYLPLRVRLTALVIVTLSAWLLMPL